MRLDSVHRVRDATVFLSFSFLSSAETYIVVHYFGHDFYSTLSSMEVSCVVFCLCLFLDLLFLAFLRLGVVCRLSGDIIPSCNVH